MQTAKEDMIIMYLAALIIKEDIIIEEEKIMLSIKEKII